MALTTRRQEMGRVGYGASEVPALVAPSKWANPSTLYLRRTRPDLEVQVGLPADLGNLLEEPVAKLYAERTGTFLARVQTLAHAETPLAIATPDRAVFLSATERGDARRKLERGELARCSRLLQIKTTDERNRDQWGVPNTDAIPENYLAQVQWEMGVAGVPVCDVGVLFGRSEFAVYTVRFDASLFAGLLDIVRHFDAHHVKALVPPPPDAGEAYASMLKTLYPVALSPVRAATPEEEQHALRFALWREVEKRAAKLKSREANALCAAIGDAAGLSFAGIGSLTYKNNRDTSKIDWQAVAEECHGYVEAAAGIIDRAGYVDVQSNGEDSNEYPAGDLIRKATPSLATIIAGHTNKTQGPRVLRPKFTGAAAFDEALPVEASLPALGAGEEEEDGE